MLPAGWLHAASLAWPGHGCPVGNCGLERSGKPKVLKMGRFLPYLWLGPRGGPPGSTEPRPPAAPANDTAERDPS